METVLKAHKGNRSENLESIADKIDRILNGAETQALEGYDGRSVSIIGAGEIRQIKGYMEQLRIIADEIKDVSL